MSAPLTTRDRLLALAPPALAFVALLAHVAVNATTTYGVHRDELLYLSMGNHLRVWRMDFPIWMSLAANASRLLGDALWIIRLMPAIAGSAIVLATAWIAGALGARPGMRALAAVAVACGPVFVGAANLFQPVVFDQLWWTLALAALAWTRRARDPRGWLLVGAALGLGLLTKVSIAFVGAGLLAALLLTPARRELATRWPWLGAAAALAIGAPTLVGQIRLGWPVLAQLDTLRGAQLARVSALDFLAGQPILVGPAIVLAIVGAAWLLRAREEAWHRELAIAPLAAIALIALGHGKPYYAAPAYPVLLAAGAAALGRHPRALVRRTSAGALSVACVATAIVTAPVALPIASPAATARHMDRLGLASVRTSNVGEALPITQDQADMLGWEALADTVARVVAALPPAERATVVLLGTNYGRAGALEHHGPARGLPPVVSPNGSFWFFGPGTRPGDPLVVVGEEPRAPAPYFASCVLAARTRNPWGVPEERAVPVTLCRGARTTLQALWPMLAGRQ